ncbi:MAG: hypothetical protein OHK0017_08670 [Patescibacteria group bacterium]
MSKIIPAKIFQTGSLFISLFALSLSSINVSAATSITANVPKFDCSTVETSIPADAPKVTVNGSNYYIGTTQVSANNQNPVVVKFTAGSQDWCKNDYEQTAVDGRGLGLMSTPAGDIYAYFSVDGGGSFNFATGNGWLTSYGSGGGPKVSVISKLDSSSGAATEGTFLRAQLSNGNTNSLAITNLVWDETNQQVQVQADSYFSPLDVNRNPISVSGSSPFNYVVILSSNLRTAVSAYVGTVTGGQTSNTGSTSSSSSSGSTPAVTKTTLPRTGASDLTNLVILSTLSFGIMLAIALSVKVKPSRK